MDTKNTEAKRVKRGRLPVGAEINAHVRPDGQVDIRAFVDGEEVLSRGRVIERTEEKLVVLTDDGLELVLNVAYTIRNVPPPWALPDN